MIKAYSLQNGSSKIFLIYKFTNFSPYKRYQVLLKSYPCTCVYIYNLYNFPSTHVFWLLYSGSWTFTYEIILKIYYYSTSTLSLMSDYISEKWYILLPESVKTKFNFKKLSNLAYYNLYVLSNWFYILFFFIRNSL